MSWPRALLAGFCLMLYALFTIGMYEIGVMTGESNLDRWFEDQNIVRVHVPTHCEVGVRP